MYAVQTQSYEKARLTPPMRVVSKILLWPLACEPSPPVLHYGYPITVPQLMQIAIDGGYTGPTWKDTGGSAGGYVAAIAHISDSIGHDVDVPTGFVNGDVRLIVSICTNRCLAKGVAEIVRKLKEFLGEAEEPKWYVDTVKWYWRK